MAKFPYQCTYDGTVNCPDCYEKADVRFVIKNCKLSYVGKGVNILTFNKTAMLHIECSHCGHKEDKEINLKEDKDE